MMYNILVYLILFIYNNIHKQAQSKNKRSSYSWHDSFFSLGIWCQAGPKFCNRLSSHKILDNLNDKGNHRKPANLDLCLQLIFMPRLVYQTEVPDAVVSWHCIHIFLYQHKRVDKPNSQ